MTYLLDVNVLVALGIEHHEFHPRVAAWIRSQRSAVFATCPITELGFVRIVSQAAPYGFSVAQAKVFLGSLKRNRNLSFVFLADDLDVEKLPSWVKIPRQTTDGHLLQLAEARGVMFATLDEGVPGAYVIPKRRG